MNKFVLKTVLFSLPITFLYLFTLVFYATDKGDLIRVGYLIDKGDYRSIFKEELEQNFFYTLLSKTNLNKSKKFTVLTLGDSFSGQKGYGYKNYLAQKNISVLHFDRFLNKNPLETAYGILNGDLLNNIKVEYIIIQSVEREIVNRSKNLDTNKIITINSLNKLIKIQQNKIIDSSVITKFSSNRIIKFPMQNIRYLFDDNAYDSDTYQVKTTEKLFSMHKNNLLFFSTDLVYIKGNNDAKAISKLNDELNDLSKKFSIRGIKLIVLPSPDKFDFYYDYIIEKKKYPKPLFFENFEKLPKTYLYINSKKMLKEQMKYQKDIYFYDDTHWSPWASKIIANELERVIRKKH